MRHVSSGESLLVKHSRISVRNEFANIFLKLKFLLKFQFSGKILIAGGTDHANEEVETIEVIDLIDMKFQHMLESSITGIEPIGFVLQDNIFLGESKEFHGRLQKSSTIYLKNFLRIKYSENEPFAKRTKYSETTNDIEYTQKILNSKLNIIRGYYLVLNNDELLVVGTHKKDLKTILQLIKLGKEPEKIGELPLSTTDFSMIKVNEDKVYIVAGIYSPTGDTKKTWIIDILENYKLIEGPVLNKTIQSPSLALMKIVNKTYLAVAGSVAFASYYDDIIPSIELLDVSTPNQIWRIGTYVELNSLLCKVDDIF